MNIRKIIILLFLAFGLSFLAVWLNKADQQKGEGDKLTITASYYPLYDFARNIGGDKVAVTNITPAGAEPHDYEPSPSTLVKVKESDVFVYNGGSFEPWVNNLLGSYPHIKVRASQDIKLLEGNDPHFWLDPLLARQIVVNIKNGLIAADPSHSEYYSSRAKRYIHTLEKLDEDFRNGLASCSKQTVISSHDALSYIAKRYGFQVEPIAGLSPEEDPSAARLAELSDLVRSEGLEYILFETLVSPRLADTIAQETGAKTLVFDPIEGLTNEDQKKGKDYLSVQRENLSGLRKALACK
ncbi:MAG TPA: zinc ABC transporter substrate-binding protein [Candidatus Saccharimonadales bacterium]|nr:zinc ABC transporter substrate-binding protein [Candidatus Saccharimonadales bacterium]